MKNLQIYTKTDLVTEPVSATEAKLFCKVSGTAEDDLFTILIKSARQAIEKYTQSSLGTKELYATWLNMPDDMKFELPYGPIQSVDAVYIIDEEGAETELTLNSGYYVYGSQDIVLSIPKFWSSGSILSYTVRIEYTAGYGGTGVDALPSALKLAVLKQIATDYELRENIVIGGATVLANEAKKLAAPYRKKVWF